MIAAMRLFLFNLASRVLDALRDPVTAENVAERCGQFVERVQRPRITAGRRTD